MDWQGLSASRWVGGKAGPYSFHVEPAAHTPPGLTGGEVSAALNSIISRQIKGQRVQNAREMAVVSKGATDLDIRSRFGPRFEP